MIEGLDFEVSPTVVAWYGAALATFMALIRLRDFWKDRASLKVTFEPSQRIYNDSSLSPEKTYIYVKVVNSGRRPTTVQKVYLARFRGPEGWLIPGSRPPLPCYLREGEHLFVVGEQEHVDLEDVSYAVAEDALGRKYYCAVAPWYKRAYRKLRR